MACHTSSTLPPPGSRICEFHKKLKNKRAEHEAESVAARIRVDSSESQRGYALCGLAKTEATSKFYRDLDNFELFDMQKSAEIIKGDIEEYVKKDADLGKKITEASKLLNELKDKLHHTNDAACAMRNCLQSHLGFKEHEVPKQVAEVTDLAKQLREDGQKAAEAMMKVAGIHTFSNLKKTLQPFGEGLTEKVTALKKFTDELIAKAKKDAEEAQKELTKVLEKLNADEFESSRAAAAVNAHDCTLDFICKCKCVPIGCVEEICKDMGECESEAGEGRRDDFTGGDHD